MKLAVANAGCDEVDQVSDGHDSFAVVQVAHHLESVEEQQREVKEGETIEAYQCCVPLQHFLCTLRCDSAPALADQNAVRQTQK